MVLFRPILERATLLVVLAQRSKTLGLFSFFGGKVKQAIDNKIIAKNERGIKIMRLYYIFNKFKGKCMGNIVIYGGTSV